MKTIICYTENGTRSFEETDLTPFQWGYANPTKELEYAFDYETELTNSESDILQNWSKYAEKYGFSHRDRNAVFKDPKTGHDFQLIQFIPANRKYKCRVKDLTNGSYYKMTTGYVKQLIYNP